MYSVLHNSHRKQLKQRRDERRIMRYTDKAFSMNEHEFKANYRVSKDLFEEIYENIKPFMPIPKRRSDISPKYKVLVALSFYATGSYQKLVGGTYGTLMSQQSVYRTIRDVTAALNHPIVQNKWIKFPQTRQERHALKTRCCSSNLVSSSSEFLRAADLNPALMKRKLCRTSFNCEDMEELNVTALSRRKESAAPLTGERESTIFRHGFGYPLALVLRLRVLQIVCGISAMVMGSVAFIEERQKFNMGLGIPAGGISVLAAAVSIHTSRGWSAMSGVAGAGAGAASVLWAAAACLLVALVVQCCRTILDPPGIDHGDGPTEEDTTPSSRDLVVIACVQIALAAATLFSAAFCARIDCGT